MKIKGSVKIFMAISSLGASISSYANNFYCKCEWTKNGVFVSKHESCASDPNPVCGQYESYSRGGANVTHITAYCTPSGSSGAASVTVSGSGWNRYGCTLKSGTMPVPFADEMQEE